MTRWLLAAVTATSLGCGYESGPASLSGEWRATINALGIASLTMTITESSNTLTATGQWQPMGETGTRTLSANGLRFESGLNMVFTFQTATGPAIFTTQGQTENEDSFYLLFPVGDDPTRVIFTRR